MKSAGIIGLGRFGTLLQQMLTPEIQTLGHDPNQPASHPLEEVLRQETIFIATPIRHFEQVITSIAPQLKPNTTIIDVCSVKVFPVNIMQQHLPPQIDIIASHPLFGPDSYNKGYNNKIMLASIRDQYQRYQFWKDFFISKDLRIEEMTPEQHDRYMASSQGITHLLGRTLKAINATPTPLNTAGYNQLLTIMDHTCNDSWELFYDLQRFNPYSKEENHKLLDAINKLLNDIEKNT